MRRIVLVLGVLAVIVAMVANPAIAQTGGSGGCELEENSPKGHCTLTSNNDEYLDCAFPRIGADATLEGTCKSHSALSTSGQPRKGVNTYRCVFSLTDGAGGAPPDSNPYLDFGTVRCSA